MLVLLECIFWLSLGFLLWTYAGYPLVMMGLARYFPGPAPLREFQASETAQPFVSIVMSVYNGSGDLSVKINNLNDLAYANDCYEIIVVDDGSTDDTARVLAPLVRANAVDGPLLHVHHLATRQGKAAALNVGIAAARGSLVVLCDLRQTLALDALFHLVQRFADPMVGAVSGELIMDMAKGPGMYWRYERSIRMAEGVFDSTVGATGALYAIRRRLFRPIPAETLIDDVFIPLLISSQGYRVVFEPRARIYDRESQISHEFQRKARTLAGNFQLVELFPGLLNPMKNRLLFQFVCHKILRLFCPYALLMLLLTAPYLAVGGGQWSLWYGFFCIGQVCCYGAALANRWVPQRYGGFFRLCRTFVILNLAAVTGLLRYLRRDFVWMR